MKQHYRLTIWSLFFLITSSGSAFAQRKTITPIDSLITVGYATGSLKTISGSVEKITETQMNKDQIMVINISGRGDKDVAAIARYRGEDLYE